MKPFKALLLALIIAYGCASHVEYDVLIRNGQIIDGSGSRAFKGDIGIMADTIAGIGDLKNAKGRTEIDAEGLTVAPGFINMLSWAVESLIEDGRSQGDIRQGVTLEVLGEGDSWGPWNEKMKEDDEGFAWETSNMISNGQLLENTLIILKIRACQQILHPLSAPQPCGYTL